MPKKSNKEWKGPVKVGRQIDDFSKRSGDLFRPGGEECCIISYGWMDEPLLQGNFFHGRRLLSASCSPSPPLAVFFQICTRQHVCGDSLRQVMDWNPTWDLLIPILAPSRGMNLWCGVDL